MIHQPPRESHEVYRRIRHRIFEAALTSPEAAQLNAASAAAAAAAAAAALAAASSPTGSSKVRNEWTERERVDLDRLRAKFRGKRETSAKNYDT